MDSLTKACNAEFPVVFFFFFLFFFTEQAVVQSIYYLVEVSVIWNSYDARVTSL